MFIHVSALFVCVCVYVFVKNRKKCVFMCVCVCVCVCVCRYFPALFVACLFDDSVLCLFHLNDNIYSNFLLL